MEHGRNCCKKGARGVSILLLLTLILQWCSAVSMHNHNGEVSGSNAAIFKTSIFLKNAKRPKGHGNPYKHLGSLSLALAALKIEYLCSSHLNQ